MSLIKINTAKSVAQDARFKTGDKVRIVKLYPYSGKIGKLVSVRGNWVDVEIDGKVIKDIDYRNIAVVSDSAAEDSIYLSSFPSYHPIHAFPEVIQKMEKCINREWPSSVNSKVSSAQRMMKDALRDLETYMRKVDADL